MDLSPRPRYFAFDIARGAAIILMVIAHTAPSDGPARILLTAEFLTAPLFALLVGAGVQLSGLHGNFGKNLLHQALRALVLFALGLLLAALYQSVVVVLAHLAGLMLVCALLTRAPWWVLGSLVPVSVFASVYLTEEAQLALASSFQTTGPGAATQALMLVAGGPYRFLAFFAYALTGMLIARAHSRGYRPITWGVLAAAGILSMATMVGGLIVPNLLGYGVHAYDGSLLETTGNLAGAAGIVVLCWAADAFVGHDPRTRRLIAPGEPGREPHRAAAYSRLSAPVRAMGRASLSLYALHILLLRLWVELTGRSDDAWVVTAGLTLFLLAFAVTWQAAWAGRRTPASAPRSRWADGPLEGALSSLPR